VDSKFEIKGSNLATSWHRVGIKDKKTHKFKNNRKNS
jgi:hypothetical protein